MSASEKLRALGRDIAMRELGKPGVGELIDALPALIAVVKAAEDTVGTPELKKPQRKLREALAALEKKLEER